MTPLYWVFLMVVICLRRKNKKLYFVLLFPLHHLAGHVYAQNSTLEEVRMEQNVSFLEGVVFTSTLTESEMTYDYVLHSFGSGNHTTNFGANRKNFDIKLYDENYEKESCSIKKGKRSCIRTYEISGKVPFREGSIVNFFDCTTECVPNGYIKFTNVEISYKHDLEWVYLQTHHKKIESHSDCYANNGRNNPIWRNSRFCTGQNFLKKKDFNWASQTISSSGCSMFSDFKASISDEDPFIPYIISCDIPCKGDGCFAAWQCRTYITLDVFYPVTSGYKVLAYRLQKPTIKYKYLIKLHGRKLKENEVNSEVYRVEEREFTLTIDRFVRPKFENQIKAFTVIYDNKDLKKMTTESFSVSSYNEFEETIPYKCKHVPFGKFVDHCRWRDEDLMKSYDSYDDLLANLRQRHQVYDMTHSNFLGLIISNRTHFKQDFEYNECDVKKKQTGTFVAFGTTIRELGNLDGYLSFKIGFQKVISSKTENYMNIVEGIQVIGTSCNILYDVVDASSITLQLGGGDDGVFVNIGVCLVTCLHTAEQQYAEEMTFKTTINSNSSSFVVIFRKDSSITKKKIDLNCQISELLDGLYTRDIYIGNDHVTGGSEFDYQDIGNKIATFFTRLFTVWWHWVIFGLLIVFFCNHFLLFL